MNAILDEYVENQFKIIFMLIDVREQKSAMEEIKDSLEETNIVINGDIWTPEVQIYKINKEQSKQIYSYID